MTALPENQGLTPSTLMAAHNSSSRGSDAIVGISEAPGTHMDIHARKTPIYIK